MLHCAATPTTHSWFQIIFKSKSFLMTLLLASTLTCLNQLKINSFPFTEATIEVAFKRLSPFVDMAQWGREGNGPVQAPAPLRKTHKNRTGP